MNDMEAGEELDILIATKVMGWKRMSWKDYHGMKKAAGKFNGDDDRDELTYAWHDKNGEMVDGAYAEYIADYYNPEPAWSPSKSVEQAWEVIGKFATVHLSYHDAYVEWWCRLDFGRCIEESCLFEAWGETAPLAICRAALSKKTAPSGWEEGRK